MGESCPDFYVVAREDGRETVGLPTWAARRPGLVRFCTLPVSSVAGEDIAAVPGAFHINGLLTAGECEQLIQISERLGYHTDSPVSLSHDVRHNDNVNWVVDESIDMPIWKRCRHLFTERFGMSEAMGLNARFRFYRYRSGDFFAPHIDGEWPGSRVREERLLHDAYGDRISRMTLLLFLSDGYRGGRTLFHLPPNVDAATEVLVPVSTPRGAGLCFPHGSDPRHCVHAGERVEGGTKYIVRTDVLFSSTG